jgi:hypothetical protein
MDQSYAWLLPVGTTSKPHRHPNEIVPRLFRLEEEEEELHEGLRVRPAQAVREEASYDPSKDQEFLQSFEMERK